jgi:hypothetical protein
MAKVVEYVSTIPSFQGLRWASVGQASSCQQIIVLIQWDSGYGWRLFQRSIGFSMMLGYVESISNRCIQLALPVDSLFKSESCLELVSFQFTAMPSIDHIAGFKSKWNDMFSSDLNSLFKALQIGVVTLYRSCVAEVSLLQFDGVFIRTWTLPSLTSQIVHKTNSQLNTF